MPPWCPDTPADFFSARPSPMRVVALLFAAGDRLGNVDGTPFGGTCHARPDDGKIARAPKAVRLGLTAARDAVGEILQLLADGVVLLQSNGLRRLLAAPEMAKTAEQLVIGA